MRIIPNYANYWVSIDSGISSEILVIIAFTLGVCPDIILLYVALSYQMYHYQQIIEIASLSYWLDLNAMYS